MMHPQSVISEVDVVPVEAAVATTDRRANVGAVLRVASGNFLEMYDFIVYGYYAVYIAKTFFPAGSDFASLMLSLMTLAPAT